MLEVSTMNILPKAVNSLQDATYLPYLVLIANMRLLDTGSFNLSYI